MTKLMSGSKLISERVKRKETEEMQIALDKYNQTVLFEVDI